MADPEQAHDPVLDSEYRQLVRSLHKDTIATVSLVDDWWNHQVFMAAIQGMNNGAEKETVDRLDRQWRDEIRPALLMLINGHPDPNVRESADFFNTRLIGAMLLVHRRPDDEAHPDETPAERREVDGLTIQLMHDGLARLRRAAYHAPFRVHRPEPDWEGIPIGNSEGLPDDILKRIKERGEHYQG